MSLDLGATDRESFHTVVAKLLFIAKRVRPDLLVPVSFLSGKVRCPSVEDLGKLVRLVNYVYHTRGTGVTLQVEKERRLNITAWVDSSFGVHQNGTGQTGCVITLGRGALYASSSKQRHVTTSSAECELAGLYDASTAIIWVRDFIKEQGFEVGPAIIKHDNESAIALAKKGFSSSKRSRHFHIKHFFIADRIKSGEISIVHCKGDEMIADALTKGLSGHIFSRHAAGILNDNTDT